MSNKTPKLILQVKSEMIILVFYIMNNNSLAMETDCVPVTSVNVGEGLPVDIKTWVSQMQNSDRQGVRQSKFFAFKKHAMGNSVTTDLNDFESVPWVPHFNTFWERCHWFLVYDVGVKVALQRVKKILCALAEVKGEITGRAWGDDNAIYCLAHPAHANGMRVANSCVARENVITGCQVPIQLVKYDPENKEQSFERYKEKLKQYHTNVENGKSPAPSPFFSKVQSPPNYVQGVIDLCYRIVIEKGYMNPDDK